MANVTLQNTKRDIKELGTVEHDGKPYTVILGSYDEAGLTDLELRQQFKDPEKAFHSPEAKIPSEVLAKLKESKVVEAWIRTGEIRVSRGFI